MLSLLLLTIRPIMFQLTNQVFIIPMVYLDEDI